ncbi:LysR family transcriptional regulator [Klebsiella huaxiensis]|uniref:LysR family transcriptional regulator n=1 Tax=Klebsiella huaxiensis TaxID=2153354 RepID=A0ABT6EE17_9ENTR|nr:LysR family transcriptional regulator [Klebsiella huaxiensis]MDG1643586.1 LysR family transcriptional regulator [Klebsiella huaxiensis]QBG08106.1 LysR family transcriptional regulator [Klebsiella huaxiensis]
MRGSDFAELRAFAMVVEQGSFTRAAAHLGVTTSTLSATIRRLEERIGVRLLHRTTRSVAPSEAGKRMMQRLAPALAGLQEAVIDAQTIDNPAGRLRLNVSRVAAIYYLSPLLGGFIQRYPNIELDIVTDDCLIDIVSAGFDAGIRLGEKLHQDMIAVRLSGDLEMKVVASPHYLAQAPRPRKPQDLLQHPCLTYRRPSDGSVYRWEFQRDNESCEIAVKGPIVVDEPEMLTPIALAGVGIAYQFAHQVDGWLASGQLVQLLPEWTPAFPGFYVYYPSRKQMASPLRAFVDYLRIECGE